VAAPSDAAAQINAALAWGVQPLLHAGSYNINQTINVTNPTRLRSASACRR
jgi:hypothetical protein